MGILVILKICALCLASLGDCVKVGGCKVKKTGFISPIFNNSKKIALLNKRIHSAGIYAKEDDNLKSSTPLLETVENPGPCIEPKGIKGIFDVDEKGKECLKEPVKLAVNSIIPELFRIFKVRRKLSLEPLVTLLSCSGGVDSMALLHSFGLIKSNYPFLVENGYIRVSGSRRDSSYFETDRGLKGLKLDEEDFTENKREEVIKALEEFFENFNVVYFNHKQRDDVDRDIKVIEEACREYDFNFIVKEIPNLLLKDEKKGSQNLFRTWRRDMCMKIIDELSSNSRDKKTEKTSRSLTNELRLEKALKVNKERDEKIDKLRNLKGLVFMAHNLDDNFETVVLKILRGSFLSNLTPMELYDNLDSQNYVLVRPFIDSTKSTLSSFMREINKEYNEDSSNSKLCYTRNIVRKLVIPPILKKSTENKNSNLNNEDNLEIKENSEIFMGLDSKLKNMSEQCNKFNDLIENEVNTFFEYINHKYNNSNNNINCNSINKNVNNNNNNNSNNNNINKERRKAYWNFYESLLRERYGEGKDKSELAVETTFNYFRRTGIKLENYFYLKEWTVIPNQLIREQVLSKFIFENLGKNVPYKTLNNLSNELEKSPFTNKVRMWSLGNLLLHHQGYLLKFYPQELVRKRKIPGNPENSQKMRELVYSDSNVNVYNSIKNLKFSVSNSANQPSNSPSNFHLNFNINPLNNSNYNNNTNNNNSNNNSNECTSSGNTKKVDLEIRYLNSEDVAPALKMWKNSVFSILGQMGINVILKYEIPAIVELGTNNVIGLYGVNLSPPYYNKDRQTILYQTSRAREPTQLRITVN